MTARMNPMPVLRAHARTLANGSSTDWLARIVMWAVPVGVGVTAYVVAWRFTAPAAVLSGVALLMGGLLSTAGVLSTLRLKLTDRDETHKAAEEAKRNLDEAVPHVLTAALACLASAVLIIVAMNFPLAMGDPTINRGFSCAIAAALTFVAVLFVATIIRLYAAYVQVNRVPKQLDGFVRHGAL
ncbi:hypothetical protein KXD96_05675 [Mycobacterium sp. SMC-2]|uniref:hypothetical protein n=1 Tax=Mycobacterium sp. SMC-2 TaxID=2857058 RepID=UPI0021B39547|nr:hypothetical protein [Mycobacterium sp. SMC-2]UXA07610.1 hypothetical protein KXD96_05675 [Mycobacterium sp. SMC-2]